MKAIVFFIILSGSLMACQSSTDAEGVRAEEAKKRAEASGDNYELVIHESELKWRGSKPGGEHYGTVQITEGTLSLDNGFITSGSFSFDMNTIICEDLSDPGMNARLVNHLKSEDFFYVQEYPFARFDIVNVIEKQDASAPESGGVVPTHDVTGNLTIRGTTKSITFPARIEISDGNIKAMTNPFGIDRTEWNVSFLSKSVIAGLKDNFIDDQMIITLALLFKAN